MWVTPPRCVQVKNMSPDDLKRQLEAATSQSSAQQQYYYKVRMKRGDGLLPFASGALTRAMRRCVRAGVRDA